MAKEKSAIVAGVQAFGASVKEAKANAVAAIEKFVRYQHQPLIFKLGPYMGVLWLELIDGHGFVEWRYTLTDTRQERPSGPVHPTISSGHSTKEEAERRMRNHAAQNLFAFGEDDPSGVLEDEGDKHSHASWCRWQRRYKDIKEAQAPISDQQIRDQLFREGL